MRRLLSEDRPLIFIHSSDELYGADRILLDLHAALPEEWRARSEYWLPTDVEHRVTPLCVELEKRGAAVRHVDLPILRRAYRTPRQLLGLARRVVLLRTELRRRRPELVYCTTSATFLAAPLARQAGVKQVVGHVQEIWSGSDAQVLGRLARSCHTLLAISRPVREALPAKLRPRTTVVLNATPEPVRQVPITDHQGPLTFLVASRWNGWKGHRTLLAAWDRLDFPGLLVILGGAPSSGETVDVPELVRGLRFPASVEIIGEVVDATPWIESADVTVVPSDSPEPFGLVAIEAFSRGRPVVASDGGGLADIVTDGSDGWTFPREDVGALHALLEGLTRQTVTEAGARARQTYEQRFTASRYAQEWRGAVGAPTSS